MSEIQRVKLHYFDVNERVDAIRTLLYFKGIDFEDFIISKEKWEELKNTGIYPLKQLPLLEIDGVVLEQSSAILEYLGMKYDLGPQNLNERFLVSYYIASVDDLYSPNLWSEDEKAKEGTIKFLEAEIYPVQFSDMEKNFLAQKANETGWLISGRPTIADMKVVANFTNWFLHPDRKERLFPIMQKYAPNLTNYICLKVETDFKMYFDCQKRRPSSRVH
mmetsp:Transcript_41958/g.48287  ORF Transcript_41958/g.48287 Transcript_41958/m.48287 type:complete len:219 (+) Transcript_41958:38-694(+)